MIKRFLLSLFLSFSFLSVSVWAAGKAAEMPDSWGSGGLFLGAGQSSELSETSSMLGGFGYGVQNNLMVGGEAYTFMGGGLKGTFAMANVGLAFDDLVRNGDRQILIPYLGLGAGSLKQRNGNEKDSGLFLSVGLHYKTNVNGHGFGARAGIVKGEGSPLWMIGIVFE